MSTCWDNLGRCYIYFFPLFGILNQKVKLLLFFPMKSREFLCEQLLHCMLICRCCVEMTFIGLLYCLLASLVSISLPICAFHWQHDVLLLIKIYYYLSPCFIVIFHCFVEMHLFLVIIIISIHLLATRTAHTHTHTHYIPLFCWIKSLIFEMKENWGAKWNGKVKLSCFA